MTAILGGGMSGLSAAYYCLDNPKVQSIALYEASNRFGGWIKSIKKPSGVVFEKGPRTIRPQGIAGANTLDLVNKLELNDKILPMSMTHPAAKNRLIYVNKQLYEVPSSIRSIFKATEPFDRPLISAIWNDMKAKKLHKEDESIYSFVERRLGKDMADYLVSPMLCGICAGNAKDISVNFLLKPAFDYEQKYGSITGGFILSRLLKLFSRNKETTNSKRKSLLVKKAQKEYWSIWTLDGGLEQFPTALKQYLRANSNVQLNTETKCEQITFKSDEAELLVNGKVEKYNKIICSLSAKNLAPLLKRQHPQLSRELEAIPCTTVAVVNLHYSTNILEKPAFGFLVAPSENLPILGCIYDSCVFKFKTKNESTVLTVMMGGAWFDKYFDANTSEEQFLSVAVKNVKKILQIQEEPVEYDVAVLRDCIPQYVVGHNERLKRIENYIAAHKMPLALCGSSYNGVGLNDVILSAKQAVSRIA